MGGAREAKVGGVREAEVGGAREEDEGRTPFSLRSFMTSLTASPRLECTEN